MTAGEDLGQRLMVEQVPLGTTGDYILIEDSKNQDDLYVRQAVFSTKLEMIQSEVLLTYKDPKKKEIPEHIKTNSEIAPKKKSKKLVVNHDFLTCDYQ